MIYRDLLAVYERMDKPSTGSRHGLLHCMSSAATVGSLTCLEGDEADVFAICKLAAGCHIIIFIILMIISSVITTFIWLIY